MKNIVYSKYYVINTVHNRMDIYENLEHLEVIKQSNKNQGIVLETGLELVADESHGKFHYWGGLNANYSVYFEVYLVELDEESFDPELDDPIEDELFVKDQKRVGFIDSGVKIEYY